MSATTQGTLLGGKLHYHQLTSGHRTGFEPVLLAASLNAKPGALVLEAGTGAGAALLCLGQRLPGIAGIGLEIDESLARLANHNFKINGLHGFSAVLADAAHPPFAAIFDHIIANPPWFAPASTRSPDAARARAHHTTPGLLATWVAALCACLKPKASLSLILPAACLGETLHALHAARLGGIALFPLWPRAGQPAKQFIITAKKGSKSPDQLLPGLILHNLTGITPEAEKILRDGAALMTAAPYPASSPQ